MSKQVRLRRGTTAQYATFTGAQGEITFDTNKNCLVVHDGVTPGGKPLLDAVIVSPSDSTAVQLFNSVLRIASADAQNVGLYVDNDLCTGFITALGIKVGGFQTAINLLGYSGVTMINLTDSFTTYMALAGNLTLSTQNRSAGIMKQIILLV